MAYERTIWKNREVERPRTFKKIENPDGTITLVPAEGNIIEPGTPIIAENMNNIEQGIVDVHSDLEEHKADYAYQKAGGTATAITLTINNLKDGYPMTFIASANNNGNATTINGKPLYKPNTTTAPNLIAGKAYTIWYNQANNCFFIKASAEGDASVSNVLAGKTFSNDNDTGLVGTMPNRVGHVTAQSVSHNGTTVRFRPQEGYYDGTPDNSVQMSDPNFRASNILEGKEIFGLVGTLKASSVEFATGTATVGTEKLTFYRYSNDSSYEFTSTYLHVKGIGFRPDIIIVGVATKNYPTTYGFASIVNSYWLSSYYGIMITRDPSHYMNGNTYSLNGSTIRTSSNGGEFRIPVGRDSYDNFATWWTFKLL